MMDRTELQEARDRIKSLEEWKASAETTLARIQLLKELDPPPAPWGGSLIGGAVEEIKTLRGRVAGLEEQVRLSIPRAAAELAVQMTWGANIADRYHGGEPYLVDAITLGQDIPHLLNRNSASKIVDLALARAQTGFTPETPTNPPQLNLSRQEVERVCALAAMVGNCSPLEGETALAMRDRVLSHVPEQEEEDLQWWKEIAQACLEQVDGRNPG